MGRRWVRRQVCRVSRQVRRGQVAFLLLGLAAAASCAPARDRKSTGAGADGGADANAGARVTRETSIEMFARGYVPDRSGQVFMVPEEGEFMISKRDSILYRFMHGSPWSYDVRIPLLFHGEGFIRQGTFAQDAGLQDIAPTLLTLLNSSVPETMTGRVLAEAMGTSSRVPAVVALLVLDGMGANTWSRLESKLPNLGRLREEGAWFSNAALNYLPCRAAPGVNANIAANVSAQNPNGIFALNQPDFQGISGFDRGNPLLEEEEGHSWTIGAVIQPADVAVLEDFAFTIDYYRIEIDNAITLRDRNFILSQCYGGGDTSLCQFVTRRPNPVGPNSAGSIEFLDADITNTGGEFAEGVDLTVAYNQSIGEGRFGARLAYTHLLDHYQIPLDGGDKDFLAGEVGDSEDRAYLTLQYSLGKFGGTLQTTWLSSADLDDQFLAAFDLPRGAVGISSVTYVDAQVTFAPTEQYEFFVGGSNLLDEEPPPLITGLPSDVTGTETDSGTYDAIGRRWYAGVRMRF